MEKHKKGLQQWENERVAAFFVLLDNLGPNWTKPATQPVPERAWPPKSISAKVRLQNQEAKHHVEPHNEQKKRDRQVQEHHFAQNNYVLIPKKNAVVQVWRIRSRHQVWVSVPGRNHNPCRCWRTSPCPSAPTTTSCAHLKTNETGEGCSRQTRPTTERFPLTRTGPQPAHGAARWSSLPSPASPSPALWNHLHFICKLISWWSRNANQLYSHQHESIPNLH